MTEAVFGTANLFGDVRPAPSLVLLRAAATAGVRHFDTAPSYGYGRCEGAVGDVVSAFDPAPVVTTKVGIRATTPPTLPTRWVKWAGRRLPVRVQRQLRGTGSQRGHGQFDPNEVRKSVEKSLLRIGPIRRLMLHEVTPDDITDELLACLAGYVRRGDVGELGVATSNSLTALCVERAPQVLRAVHIAVGVFASPVALPPSVTVRVGHGVLGPAAADLRRLESIRANNAELAAQWRDATRDTRWSGPDGLASALIARAATLELTEVIVATSRPANVATLRTLVGGDVRLDQNVSSLIERLACQGRTLPVGQEDAVGTS